MEIHHTFILMEKSIMQIYYATPLSNTQMSLILPCPFLRRKSHYDLQASTTKGRNFLLVDLIDTHPRLLSNSITVLWKQILEQE